MSKQEFLLAHGWGKWIGADENDEHAMIWGDPINRLSWYTLNDAYFIELERYELYPSTRGS